MLRAKGEIIRFATRDGFLLDGFLMRSRRRDACAVYVHGMTGNFYGGDLPFAMASRLNGKGIALFTINTRGHDIISSAYRTQAKIRRSRAKRLTLGTSLERFEDCVLDIGGAIRELQKLGYKRFILAGHSTGCQKVAYYQYKKGDRRIKGLILLAPASDYEANKKMLGKRFNTVVKMCKKLVQLKKGRSFKRVPLGFSAKRFLSVADLKNVEARLFNYNGPLKEICQVRAPVLALFGSADPLAPKPTKRYMELLKTRRGINPFQYALIKDAKHNFGRRSDDAAKIASEWAAKELGKA